MGEPEFGRTAAGRPVHARTSDHLPGRTRAARFNRVFAIAITHTVGTMWCAYAFAALSLTSLPSVLAEHSLVSIVSWVAQTFLQLVLLSVIIVGQNIQAEASDARAAKTFEDSEKILALLGPAADLMATLERIEGELRAGRQ